MSGFNLSILHPSFHVGLIMMEIRIEQRIIWIEFPYTWMFTYHFLSVFFRGRLAVDPYWRTYVPYNMLAVYFTWIAVPRFQHDPHTMPVLTMIGSDIILSLSLCNMKECQTYKTHPLVFSCQMSTLNILRTAFACFLVLWFSHHKWWNTAQKRKESA